MCHAHNHATTGTAEPCVSSAAVSARRCVERAPHGGTANRSLPSACARRLDLIARGGGGKGRAFYDDALRFKVLGALCSRGSQAKRIESSVAVRELRLTRRSRDAVGRAGRRSSRDRRAQSQTRRPNSHPPAPVLDRLARACLGRGDWALPRASAAIRTTSSSSAPERCPSRRRSARAGSPLTALVRSVS